MTRTCGDITSATVSECEESGWWLVVSGQLEMRVARLFPVAVKSCQFQKKSFNCQLPTANCLLFQL
jgi:hypothetical protein